MWSDQGQALIVAKLTTDLLTIMGWAICLLAGVAYGYWRR